MSLAFEAEIDLARENQAGRLGRVSRIFDREEAEAILARAALLSRGDGLSLEDLKDAAQGAGISAEHIDRALLALEEDKKNALYLER